MANEQESKIVLERSYNIPLRRKFIVAPTHKRANRAVKAVREFLQRHMKSDDVKLGHHLNLKLWERGIKNPPHSVKINAIKDDKGVVRAEIVGKEIQLEQEKKEQKEEGGMAEKLGLKKEEQQPEKNTYTPGEQTEQQESEEKTTEAESSESAAEQSAEEASGSTAGEEKQSAEENSDSAEEQETSEKTSK